MVIYCSSFFLINRALKFISFPLMYQVQCPLEVVNLRASRDLAVLDLSYKFGTAVVPLLPCFYCVFIVKDHSSPIFYFNSRLMSNYGSQLFLINFCSRFQYPLMNFSPSGNHCQAHLWSFKKLWASRWTYISIFYPFSTSSYLLMISLKIIWTFLLLVWSFTINNYAWTYFMFEVVSKDK